MLDLKKDVVKDFGTILLASHNLDEVVIKGERSPVTIRKDTIEFNTEAFKTRPNAVVEELLRKLPGVQVNVDGSILVNGKSISKLLIDGKEFFGNDPKVATKNLDADMVDKIQVYDDRENDPDHLVSETQVAKIINLKMKSKIKKSTLGKIYGGGGSRDRYETAGILSNFRDTLQVSLIGLANNLNKTGFSGQDLYSMGGFDRSGGSQVYDGTFGGRNYGGLENVASAGVNINNNYGKKLKLNLVYFFTHTERIYNSQNYNEQFLPDTRLVSFSQNRNTNKNNKHAFGGLVEWVPDTINRIRYEPKFSFGGDNNINGNFGNSSNTAFPKLRENSYDATYKSNNIDFSHNFNFYRRLKKKGESINITHSIQFSNNEGDRYSLNNIVSYTADVKSERQDRYEDSWRKSTSVDLSLTYNFPIISDKLILETNAYAKYSGNKDQLSLSEKNPLTGTYDFLQVNLSNDLQRNIFTQNIRPQLLYKINKNYSIRLGVKAELMNVKNVFNYGYDDIDQKFSNFFPSVRIDGPGISFSYDERLDLPSISQMQPIVRVYNSLYQTTGNPDLVPSRVKSFNFNLYKYNHSKQINFNVYSGINFSNNVVIQQTKLSSAGVNTTTYVNRNGSANGYMGINFGKQFKKSQKWQIGLNTNLNLNLNRRQFILNTDEGFENNFYIYAGENISFNYNELLSINARYNFTKQMTRYDVNFNDVNTYSHTVGSDFSLRWPKKIILDVNYSYNYNPQIAEGFRKSSHFLNLALSLQMLKKDRGQLKISVYDLLDQNISVSRYAYNNAVNISDREILKRYFLVTYQYKLNIFKGK
jgi:hypothetical protein